MLTDITDLRDFYSSPLGFAVQRLLCARLAEFWPTLRGERIAALGYAPPLRESLARQATVYALMPAAQGVLHCPAEGPNASCLVSPYALPLGDSSVDRVVALHALEGLAEPALLLREMARVMKGNGRLLLIVPNRKGVWARNDRTPFGCGQPFSTAQVRKLLKNQGFLIERMQGVLFAPPSAARINLALADKTERILSRLLPYFGGVLMVEASLQICAPIGLRTKLRVPFAVTAPLPVSCYAAC